MSYAVLKEQSSRSSPCYLCRSFSDVHGFTKPNDAAALDLMDHAARHVLDQLPDVVLAFGESDEYSFLIRRAAQLYRRRESKIVSLIASHFTSAYVAFWSQHMPPERLLRYPPSFDGRVVMYPSEREVRDYFAWRQADSEREIASVRDDGRANCGDSLAHINNLYNTTFWALVQSGGQTAAEAHKTLEGTFSSDKNEILFGRFGINYAKLPEKFRKGSVVLRQRAEAMTTAAEVRQVSMHIDSPGLCELTSTRRIHRRKRRQLQIRPTSNIHLKQTQHDHIVNASKSLSHLLTAPAARSSLSTTISSRTPFGKRGHGCLHECI